MCYRLIINAGAGEGRVVYSKEELHMTLYRLRKDQEWKPESAIRMDNGLYVDSIQVSDAKVSRFLERHSEEKFFIGIIDRCGRDLGFYKVPIGFTCNDIVSMNKQVMEGMYIVWNEGLKAPKLFGAARKAYEKKQEALSKASGPKLETVIEDKPIVFNGLVFNIGG